MSKIFLYGILFFLIACNATKKTIITNKNVLNNSSKNIAAEELFFAAGKARLNKENKTAIEKYKMCLALTPNNSTANYYVAKLLMADDNAKEAKTFAKQAANLEPNNIYYQEQYAQILYGIGQAKEAIAIYKNLATLKPHLADDYLGTAAYYCVQSKNYNEAIQLINQIEEKFGPDQDLTFKKINIYRRTNNIPEVLKNIDKLIADNPGEIKYQMLKIDALEDAKDTAAANAIYNKLSITHPNDPDVITALIFKTLEKKDTATYFKMLDGAMNNKFIEPEQKVNMLIPVMAMAEKDTNRKPYLLKLSQQMMAATPNDAKALAIYGSILLSNDKLDDALVVYKKLIAKAPNKFDNWQTAMSLHSSLQQPDSLIAVSKQAMNYFPNQAIVYYMNGIGHQQKNNNEQAIKSFNKAADFAEGNPALQVQVFGALGDIYNTTKNYIESDKAFEAALALNKNEATILNNYAYYLSERNEKLDKAAVMSIKSLEIRKNEKTFLDTYAWILYKQQKYDEAKTKMLEALAAPGENDATMLEHTGDVFFKLKDIDTAIQYWQKAKAAGSTNPNIDKKIADKILYNK
jgi:tetratricopeptide (TPR) repeat protein